jgi:hypothetical protein
MSSSGIKIIVVVAIVLAVAVLVYRLVLAENTPNTTSGDE